jgi:hypothetical protein
MPIPLGVLAQAGAGGGGPTGTNVYELLETQILSNSTTNSISFSNLNSSYGSTYQHLQLRIVAKSAANANLDSVRLRFNSDTGNNYASHLLQGDGSAVTSSANSSAPNIVLFQPPGGMIDSGNSWAPVIIDILDPFETTKNTTLRSLSGNSAPQFPRIFLRSAFWNNTAAITGMEIFISFIDNKFASGTRFSLYGMRSS